MNLSKALDNIDECLCLLKKKFQYNGDIFKVNNGYWVLSNGDILDCGAHGNIDLFLIKQGFIENLKKEFNVYDGSQFMDEINAVRVRNEIVRPHLKAPAYLTLPKHNMSSYQRQLIDKWIEDVLARVKTYLIIDNGKQAKTYKLFEEEIAKEDIRTFYRVGEFL